MRSRFDTILACATRLVTLAFNAPYRCSYLLTYLLTYLRIDRLTDFPYQRRTTFMLTSVKHAIRKIQIGLR